MNQNKQMSTLFDREEVRDVLRDEFYEDTKAKKSVSRKRPEKDPGYKVVCISLYNEDLDRLDNLVAQAKERGHRKVSRSSLVRFALAHVDLAELPKTY